MTYIITFEELKPSNIFSRSLKTCCPSLTCEMLQKRIVSAELLLARRSSRNPIKGLIPLDDAAITKGLNTEGA